MNPPPPNESSITSSSPSAATDSANFDATKHAEKARLEYRKIRPKYEEVCTTIAMILRESCKRKSIAVHSITYRTKDEDSFAKKAAKVHPDDPRKPKYLEPLRDITDLAGVRVITYFLSQVQELESIANSEFEILERLDKSQKLWEDDKFGYQSVHLLVRLKHPRTQLPEYEALSPLVVEIQIRTILQHAWAEIEHDIQYKSKADIPIQIRRRFLNLAGLLEIADREFEFIHGEDRNLREEAKQAIESGESEERIPITSDNIKLLLDKEIGPDRRVSEWYYSFVGRTARNLGLTNIGDLKRTLDEFDWDLASRAQWDVRPSPPAVLEEALLQKFGEKFIDAHPWHKEEWFRQGRMQTLNRIQQARKK